VNRYFSTKLASCPTQTREFEGGGGVKGWGEEQ